MNTNTQTPRTDAAEQRDITGLGVVQVDFARRLECELADYRARTNEIIDEDHQRILALIHERDTYKARAEERRALRVEIEQALGMESKPGDTSDDALKQGLATIAALRAALARVTAERDRLNPAWEEYSAQNATLRARVAELESTISTAAKGNQSLAERLEQCEYFREQDKEGWMVLKARPETVEQRNAELVAALWGAAGGLRNCMDMLDELDGLDWGEDGMPFTIDWDYLKPLLARAESATATVKESLTVKRSPQTDAESLIAACIPGGSICDPQQVADTIREYLRTQEPCGGRCGDPECDLDTTGVTMRTPAPHADTARTHACPECYGGHFKPCQVCGDTGRMEMRAPAPAASVDEEIARRANNGTLDAAMKGGGRP